MITIFSTFKPFRGHVGLIQRNALESWTRLRPKPEILLFGDEDGTAMAAKQLGLQHFPNIRNSENGTPLVSDLFTQAQRQAHNRILCYVNADIVLMADFIPAVQAVERRKSTFLMIGQRWDVDILESIDFRPHWEQLLRQRVARDGILHSPTGIDYFVFDRDLWTTLPPFAIGRVGYDNWLVYEATRRRAAVIDATGAIMAVHQNHDYAHLPGGSGGIQQSADALQNLALVGDGRFMFTIEDASWLLTPNGLAAAHAPKSIVRRCWRWLQRTTAVLKAVLRWCGGLAGSTRWRVAKGKVNSDPASIAAEPEIERL